LIGAALGTQRGCRRAVRGVREQSYIERAQAIGKPVSFDPMLTWPWSLKASQTKTFNPSFLILAVHKWHDLSDALERDFGH
jgi:hypothetical protein